MIHKHGCKNLQHNRKYISLTMLYKVINAMENKDKITPANTQTRSKNEHKDYIMTQNTNKYKCSFFP